MLQSLIRNVLFMPPNDPTQAYTESLEIPVASDFQPEPPILSQPKFGINAPISEERLGSLAHINENGQPDKLFFVIRNTQSWSSIREHRIPCLFVHYDPMDKHVSRRMYPTLLFCHGNAEDIGSYSYMLRQMSINFRANIMIFDYAGYGLHSIRSPSVDDTLEDAMSVYNCLWSNLSVPADRTIIFGRSLGSGPACHVAERLSVSHNHIGGLILLSGFKSAVKSKLDIWFPGDVFTNYLLAPNISCPTLILHGDQDLVIPFQNSIDMAELMGGRRELISLRDVGHNFSFVSTAGTYGRHSITLTGNYRRFFGLCQFQLINNLSMRFIARFNGSKTYSMLRFHATDNPLDDTLILFMADVHATSSSWLKANLLVASLRRKLMGEDSDQRAIVLEEISDIKVLNESNLIFSQQAVELNNVSLNDCIARLYFYDDYFDSNKYTTPYGQMMTQASSSTQPLLSSNDTIFSKSMDSIQENFLDKITRDEHNNPITAEMVYGKIVEFL